MCVSALDLHVRQMALLRVTHIVEHGFNNFVLQSCEFIRTKSFDIYLFLYSDKRRIARHSFRIRLVAKTDWDRIVFHRLADVCPGDHSRGQQRV